MEQLNPIQEMWKELTKLFEPQEIEWRALRVGKTAGNGKIWAQLAPYVNARAIQNRLDTVLGPEGWQFEVFALLDGIGGRLSIKVNDEWISKCDGANCTVHFEPIKGGISDALKRCANMFGIGRYLYFAKECWAKKIEEGKIPYDKKGWAIPLYNRDQNVEAWCPVPNINDYLTKQKSQPLEWNKDEQSEEVEKELSDEEMQT